MYHQLSSTIIEITDNSINDNAAIIDKYDNIMNRIDEMKISIIRNNIMSEGGLNNLCNELETNLESNVKKWKEEQSRQIDTISQDVIDKLLKLYYKLNLFLKLKLENTNVYVLWLELRNNYKNITNEIDEVYDNLITNQKMTSDKKIEYEKRLNNEAKTFIKDNEETAKSTRYNIAEKALIKIKVNEFIKSEGINRFSNETENDFLLRISTYIESKMKIEKEYNIHLLTDLHYKFILLFRIKTEQHDVRSDLLTELTQNYDDINIKINAIYEYLKNAYIIHAEEENNIRTELNNKAVALADKNGSDVYHQIIKQAETKIKKDNFIKIGYTKLSDDEDDSQFVLRIEAEIKAADIAAGEAKAKAEAEDRKISILKERASELNESNNIDVNLEYDIINHIIELIKLYIYQKRLLIEPAKTHDLLYDVKEPVIKDNIIKIFKRIKITIEILSSKSLAYYTNLLQKLNELLIPIQLYMLDDKFIELFLSDILIYNEIIIIKSKNTDYKEKADDMYTKIQNYIKHDLEIRNDKIENEFTQLEESKRKLVDDIVKDINKYFKIISLLSQGNNTISYTDSISLITNICEKINRIDNTLLPYIIYYLSIKHNEYRLDIFTYSNIMKYIDPNKLATINLYIDAFKKENNIEDIIKLLKDYNKNPYTQFLNPLSRHKNQFEILAIAVGYKETTDRLVLSYKSKNDKLVEEIEKKHQNDATEAAREARAAGWGR